jgi:hypothetical protein
MKKAEEINLVLLQPEVDLWRLRELALSEGGLVNGTKILSVHYFLVPHALVSHARLVLL